MQFDILTLFPAIFKGFFEESLIKKALERGLISIDIHDIRSETSDKHKTADDVSFGGGPGMVMKLEPLKKLLDKVRTPSSKVVFMTPSGNKLSQDKARELSKADRLIIICGRYEGVDERIRAHIDEEISIGDYVLTGGELPAAVLIDCISRYVPGVVKEADSVENDSFSNILLDHPHYTKPSDIDGDVVPSVLLSGDHEGIRLWRRKKQLERTLFLRPDLFAKATMNEEDKDLMNGIITGD